MNYWLLRSKWGTDDRTRQFIRNDEWKNEQDGKYTDIVNRIEEGDVLFLSDNSLFHYYGVCVANEQDGRHITVDNWKKFPQPIVFPAKAAYLKRIVKINDNKLIEKVILGIEKLKEEESICIKSINLKNFTLFEREYLLFSSGVNVLIGENGTSKTQLMKLMYSILKSNNELTQEHSIANLRSLFRISIEKNIKSILKPEHIDNLIYKNEINSEIHFDLKQYSIKFYFTKDDEEIINLESDYSREGKRFFSKKSIFFPAKEILSFYTGFRSIYNQTSFDATFDDLANHLGRLVPKNRVLENFEEKILKDLEEILGGKIILEQDRFYLLEEDGNKREITLVAEGARKLGTIFHLLANGTIEKGSVVFWDEPESNLNPKFIRYMAKMLLKLEKAGIQIFIATHSLFLVREIEILREEENSIKYFGFGFDEDNKLRVSDGDRLTDLEDVVFLDESLSQSNRYLTKRNG